MDELSLERVTQSGWNFSDSMWNSLSEYDKRFAVLHFSSEMTPDYYKKKLELLGFTDLEKVLDAGCGMGQWTIALGELNRCVEGIDISENRLKIAHNLAINHNITDCSVMVGTLEELPYADESFDAIFCCQCFMFTHMKKTLSEFNRILKPNGKLYVNVNDIGWYLFLLLDRGFIHKEFDSIVSSITYMINSILPTDRNRIVSKRWLATLFRDTGFDITFCTSESDDESESKNKSKIKNPSRYYHGFSTLIELSAIKRN